MQNKGKMRFGHILGMFAAGICAVMLAWGAGFSRDWQAEADATVQKNFQRWKSIAAADSLSAEEKNMGFQRCVRELFYLQRLSQQLLHDQWADMSLYQQQQFSEALAASIAAKISQNTLLQESGGESRLVLSGAEDRGEAATLEYRFVTGKGALPVTVYMLRSPEGQWKITNLKLGEDSLMRYYYNFCKELVDDYSVNYAIAELGNYGYVVLEDFEDSPVNEFPRGFTWKSKDNDKRKPYVVKEENGNRYLEATDRGESVIIGKTVRWNLNKYRYVSFRWRAHKLPEGGDERYGRTVDSAAGIYFIYKKKLGLIPESVKYVWSTTLPVGSAMLRSGVGKPWMVVAESGTEHLGEWRTYVFDAYEAYQKTFGGTPPDTPIGIGILSDANSTHGMAYADYDDIRAVQSAGADSGVRQILEAE